MSEVDIVTEIVNGQAVFDGVVRNLLHTLARCADAGALDSDEAREGALAVSMQLLREASKAAIPGTEASFSAWIDATRVIEDFTAELAQ